MQHEVEYLLNGQKKRHLSTLVAYGENSSNTAMAQLVGLPLAIGVKHILLGNITTKGVVIPIEPEVYEPVMAELKELGVGFDAMDIDLDSFNEYFSDQM